MRAQDFIYGFEGEDFNSLLTELKLDVPDQMVTVQIPLRSISNSEEIVNPGKRAGENGEYKWSPPLQQHLDAVKDAVGPSDNEITVDQENQENQEDSEEELKMIPPLQQELELLKKSAGVESCFDEPEDTNDELTQMKQRAGLTPVVYISASNPIG